MFIKPSRLALAQTTAVLGDVAANVQRHVEIAKRALADNASAVVFPELSLTGYVVRDLNFELALRLREDPPELRPLLELSNEITIICGAIEEDDRGAVYNTALCLEDGKILHVHRKLYPPTYGLFEERRYFSDGSQLMAFDSRRLGRIGVVVCEDFWHPAVPYILAHDNAQLIIAIAASPTRLDTGEDALSSVESQNYVVNREHHATYARLFGAFVAFVNRVGVEDGVNFWGGSEIVSPSGEPILRCADFDEDLRTVDIDPAQVRLARQLSRHFLDDDPRRTLQLLYRVLERK
jgi:predicted amidohydrolase